MREIRVRLLLVLAGSPTGAGNKKKGILCDKKRKLEFMKGEGDVENHWCFMGTNSDIAFPYSANRRVVGLQVPLGKKKKQMMVAVGAEAEAFAKRA